MAGEIWKCDHEEYVLAVKYGNMPAAERRLCLELLCYDANMMQIIGSIFVCQQCWLIMDEKRAIRFESMACT